MEYLTLKDIAVINMGQSPDSKTYNEEKEGIPFYQGKSDFGKINPIPRVWCSNPIKIAEKDDILISVRAPIGDTNIATEKCCIGRGLASIRPLNENVNKKYLYYLLDSKYKELNKFGTGSTFKAITKENLCNLKCAEIPDIKEQIEVVKKLDNVSQIIEIKKKQLEELNIIIKSQFVEMFENCENKDLIGNVIEICRGASPRPINNFITEDADGINWIKIGDVSENSLYITNTKEKITKDGAEKSREVFPGDFILSNSMSFGRPYILKIHGCVHDGWLIMSNFSKTFNELYLYYAIRDDEVQNQFRGKVNGATVKNLNSDLVKNTYIKIPSMNLQNQFAEFVKLINKQKFEIENSLKEMQELYEALMEKYFG